MADEEKDFLEKLNDKMDNHKFTPLGQKIIDIGGGLSLLLAIVCLIEWIKEGLSFGNIVGSELILCLICGVILWVAGLIGDAVYNFYKKL